MSCSKDSDAVIVKNQSGFIDEDNRLQANSTTIRIIGGTEQYKAYEDSSFVAGDSPVVHDFNTDLGKNGREGYIVCDGTGNILVEIANKSFAYGDQFTMKENDILNFQGLEISKVRLTHSGTDSAYRIWVIPNG